MIKKFSSPKMQNRQFFFTPKIQYKLVAERSEANLSNLRIPFWCWGSESNRRPLPLQGSALPTELPQQTLPRKETLISKSQILNNSQWPKFKPQEVRL